MSTAPSLSPAATPPSPGLYFTLRGEALLPGDSVLITDIGDSASGGAPLTCVTTNVNMACCRGRDGGVVGEWYHPDGTIVLRNADVDSSVDNVFTRSGFTHEVHLNRRANAMGPLGVYSCIVPDEVTGADVSASITLVDQIQGG